jgi:hypothetical protein
MTVLTTGAPNMSVARRSVDAKAKAAPGWTSGQPRLLPTRVWS